jgi:hypothetical protein
MVNVILSETKNLEILHCVQDDNCLMIMGENNQKTKTKDFWNKYEYKIVLAVGFILVSVISFEAGILQGNKLNQEPIIIEKPVENTANNAPAVQGVSQGQNLPSEAKNEVVGANTQPQTVPTGRQDCAFVGSKNSNKYHLPTCRYAKNIKSENLVCFSDENEAKSKGYLPDKNCIK